MSVASFNGVAIGNIAEVNGIPIANIAKINGQDVVLAVPPNSPINLDLTALSLVFALMMNVSVLFTELP